MNNKDNILLKYKHLVPIGTGKINVYSEGNGNLTIIFLSGSGVTSPVLEYKSLYSKLSDEYKIAVIEKSGYGFSQSTGTPRTVKNMVEENRNALLKAGITPPYVLAPHSYSGFEAIYWANSYPDEIKAVFSIDMGVPSLAMALEKVLPHEKRLKFNEKRKKLFSKIVKQGFLAKITYNWTVNTTGLMKSDFLNHDEKELYKKLFYINLMNEEIFEENMLMTKNAENTSKTGLLKVPAFFYISDMKMPLKTTTWRSECTKYAESVNAEYKYTDSGHSMYTVIPEEIAQTFKNFLKNL